MRSDLVVPRTVKSEDKQPLKVDEHHKDHLEDAFDEAQVLVVWRVDDGEGAKEPWDA